MDKKMKAVAVTGEREAGVIEIRKPVRKPGQVLIKVRACALCTWEQRIYTGVSKMELPFVAGHEIAGEVAEVGEEIDCDSLKVGDRVAVRVLPKCGACYYCRRGEENLCIHTDKALSTDPGVFGRMGGLGEYISAEPSEVWKYSGNLSFEEMALTEPVACVLNSIERGNPQMGDDAVIIGGGIMGMLHLMCLKLRGARTIMSEPDENRRKLALELGCDILINPLETDPVEAVRKITDGRGAEVVFNTTAIAAVSEQAVKMTGSLGRCVIYSSQHPDRPIAVSPNWLHNSEAVITGALSPSVRSFDRAVNLLSKKLLNVRPLISGAFPCTEANKAFEAAISKDTYRVVIRF